MPRETVVIWFFGPYPWPLDSLLGKTTRRSSDIDHSVVALWLWHKVVGTGDQSCPTPVLPHQGPLHLTISQLSRPDGSIRKTADIALQFFVTGNPAPSPANDPLVVYQI
jgi:hypothetical protein